MSSKHARIGRIRKLCPYRYDDPIDGRDMCSKLGCHCVAMDSPYSHVERGESICRVYNSFQADRAGKECVICHRSFVPSSNRQKYCKKCKAMLKREKDSEMAAKQKANISLRFRASGHVEL